MEGLAGEPCAGHGEVFDKQVTHWLTRPEADPPEPKDKNHAI